MFNAQTLSTAHQHCACHRQEVERSEVCGCFYCEAVFPPAEIVEWLEETSGNFSTRPDPWTAKCPKCGIDAVIGNAAGFPISNLAFLKAMHIRWFGDDAQD